jgi:hypothetical protein
MEAQTHGECEFFRRLNSEVSGVTLRPVGLSKFAAFGLGLVERCSLPSSFVPRALVSFRNIYRISLDRVVVYCYNPSVYEKETMPRNELSWNEHEARFKNAEALAEFLDLEPSGETRFRSEYPDFLPPFAWQAIYYEPKSASGKSAVWLQVQRRLAEVWLKSFPEKEVVELISSTFLDATAESGSLDAYRKAILFLYGESWRAKICRNCGRHFIANDSRSKCCSGLCSATWRKQYKAERHERVKKKLNARRRRDYAKRRGA